MIGLVETMSGVVALTDIKTVQHVPGDTGRADRYLIRCHSQTGPVGLFEHEYVDLKTRPIQIMPAEPGTRLISTFSLPGDEVASTGIDPVLAWALCYDGQVRPILPSGVRRDYRFHDQNVWHPDYVHLPDGTICQYGLETDPGTYADIEEVIAAETKRMRRHEAEQRRRGAEKRQDGEGIAA